MTFKTNRVFLLLVGIMISFFAVNMLSMALQMPSVEFVLMVSIMCLLFALGGLAAIATYFQMEKEVEFTETSILVKYSRNKVKEIAYSEIKYLEIAKRQGARKPHREMYVCVNQKPVQVYQIFFYDEEGELIYRPSISFRTRQFKELLDLLSTNDEHLKRLLELEGDIFNRKSSLKWY